MYHLCFRKAGTLHLFSAASYKKEGRKQSEGATMWMIDGTVDLLILRFRKLKDPMYSNLIAELILVWSP